MTIVIDIPEKTYSALTHTEFDANLVVDEMRKAIANGTPLPEHHGRLIDLNDLYDFDRRKVEYAPTIIEGSDSE